MIKDNINKQIGDALKAHDELRLTTLRGLSSALNYENIAKQHELSEDEEIAVVRREVKKRNDTVETYKNLQNSLSSQAGKTPSAKIEDQIKKEQAEIAILKEYLPPEMDEGVLQKIVDDAISETGASTIKDMGKVMGIVKAKAGNAADGSKIAELVKKALVTSN